MGRSRRTFPAAEGMLVMTGPGAPRADTVEAGGTTFAFKFLTTGEEALCVTGRLRLGRN